MRSMMYFLALVLAVGAPISWAQVPPAPPADDFPRPLPPEGKKAKKKPADPLHHPERKGVKPPMPVTPPTPEPTAPDEPGM